MPSTRAVPFNDVEALERALAPGDVAAVLCEPALTNCGLVLPAAVPHAIIARVSGATIKVLAAGETKDSLLGLGYEPIASTSAAFAAFIRAELERWPKVFKAAGIEGE